jgi:hypothetical protein
MLNPVILCGGFHVRMVSVNFILGLHLKLTALPDCSMILPH